MDTFYIKRQAITIFCCLFSSVRYEIVSTLFLKKNYIELWFSFLWIKNPSAIHNFRYGARAFDFMVVSLRTRTNQRESRTPPTHLNKAKLVVAIFI